MKCVLTIARVRHASLHYQEASYSSTFEYDPEHLSFPIESWDRGIKSTKSWMIIIYIYITALSVRAKA